MGKMTDNSKRLCVVDTESVASCKDFQVKDGMLKGQAAEEFDRMCADVHCLQAESLHTSV